MPAPKKKPARKKVAKKAVSKKVAPKKPPLRKAATKPPVKKTISPKKGGAPKGNQFWKMRTKHGRDKLFTDPKLLWKSATEYFQWCDDHPLIGVEFYGKDAVKCEVPKMRPYTYQGLCTYLDCDTETFHKLKKDEGFIDVYTRICRIIYTQKFEGAAAGFLNASIIARDLGLKDATDITTKGDKITPEKSGLDLSKLSLETLKELAGAYRDTAEGS